VLAAGGVVGTRGRSKTRSREMVEDGEVDGESQESGQLPVQASDGDMIEDDITEDLYRK